MSIVGKITSGVVDRVSRTAKHYYGPYRRDCSREFGTPCEQTLGVVFKMYTLAPVALLISPFYTWLPREAKPTTEIRNTTVDDQQILV